MILNTSFRKFTLIEVSILFYPKLCLFFYSFHFMTVIGYYVKASLLKIAVFHLVYFLSVPASNCIFVEINIKIDLMNFNFPYQAGGRSRIRTNLQSNAFKFVVDHLAS